MSKNRYLDYWYDQQIRNYLIQFTRVFSVFSYAAGTNEDGSKKILPVPARYASTDRMVSAIQRNQSENTMLSVPMFTVYLSGIEIDRSRTQVDEYVEKRKVYERDYNEETKEYGSTVGNTFLLERKMPVPLNLEIKVDLWTSNIEQKLQLFEQVCVLFNPSLDLQANTNVFDWTALTIIEPTNYNFSSRTIPIGTESEIDIMEMTFKCPIWISPPAKLKPMKIIHRIINNILDVHNIDKTPGAEGIKWDSEDLMARIIHTPRNHQIRIEDNVITLLTSGGNEKLPNGDVLVWENLISRYGKYREGISEIRLRFVENLEDDTKDVRGVFYFHPEPNKLYWYVDPITLPPNTLPPINGIVNPHTVYPGNGLPLPALGQRYIITDEIGSTTVGWGSLTANKNDIIEYNGTNWFVSFPSAVSFDRQFLINLNTNKQLLWTGQKWIYSIEGQWRPGTWIIML
ncbi:MAG: tail sheath stabilizer and completion protein [Candidatus Dojkabacteria bacterium]|nr:tail sheath stabilizer and completion protein [Candidatus Dojkabacteria bacterium]